MNDTHWTRLGLIGDWIPASLLTAQTNYFGNRTGIRADASAFRQFPHKSTKLSMFEGLMLFFIRLEHYVLLTLIRWITIMRRIVGSFSNR